MQIKDLENISTQPGVYIWKDSEENVLYVGKAVNLKKRMIQYFRGALNSYKTASLVEKIHSFEVHICNSPKEALVLENTLIKKFDPPYNILLVDDKNYPYIRVKNDEKSFDVSIIYKLKKSRNSQYYGPFPTGYGVGALCGLLKRETCFRNGLPLQKKDETPEYWERQTKKIKQILTLKDKNFLNELEEKMQQAAQDLNFEIANEYKNAIIFLKKIKEEQVAKLKSDENLDFVAVDSFENHLFITMVFYRLGAMVAQKQFILEHSESLVLDTEAFLSSYYLNHPLPNKLFLPQEVETLEEKFFENTKIIVPKIGRFKKILELAKVNNQFNKEERFKKFLYSRDNIKAALEELKMVALLKSAKSFVIFDNSFTISTKPVSVAVVYTNGLKQKSKYRSFYFKKDERAADIELLDNVLREYFAKNNTSSLDFVIVDGGVAHFNQAQKTLKEINQNLPVIALTKNEKHLTASLIDSQGKIKEDFSTLLLNFLRGVQIEVDRFAKNVHSISHQKTLTQSLLRQVKGVGENIENKLLAHFVNYNNIYNASVETLSTVVNQKLAKRIFEFLRSRV